MKIIDITFDLETTSLSADAAILQIGAVAWDSSSISNSPFFDFGEAKSKEKGFTTTDPDMRRKERCMYLRNLPLTGQFLAGCDIDKDTQCWWMQQDFNVKNLLLSNANKSVEASLTDFFVFIDEVCDRTNADAFNLWCQGPDIDIAILKMAAKRFLNINPHDFPIAHTRFRDCRTVILTSGIEYMMNHAEELNGLDAVSLTAKKADLYNEYIKDPNVVYKYLPPLPHEITDDAVPYSASLSHNALTDAITSSWNTWCVLQNYNPKNEAK